MNTMTFNAGNMPICDGCDEQRCCDEGDLMYCALGEKIDSSLCARWQNHLVAQEMANLIGRAIDRLPDGEYDSDSHYHKCRLTDRITDALADYFNESWSHDLDFLVSWPRDEMVRS
jgi:hypothetical protein